MSEAINELACDAGAPVPESVLRSQAPVVLRGFVAHWPVVEAVLDSEMAFIRYITQFATSQPLTAYVNDTPDGRFFYNKDYSGFNFRAGKATMAEVLAQLADPARAPHLRSIYVGSTPVDNWLPGFRKQNDVSIGAEALLVNFWLGSQTSIAAHHDFPDNLACVVAGRRTFTLFPPEQIGNLYVGPLDVTPSGQAISLVDFANPDHNRFPRFAQALEASRVATLSPGDALFIPSMWWHHVSAEETLNMLVNYWWCQTPQYLGSPMAALLHTMMSVRDLPASQRAAWQQLFEHYVFAAQESNFEHIPAHVRGSLSPLDEQGAAQLRRQVADRLGR